VRKLFITALWLACLLLPVSSGRGLPAENEHINSSPQDIPPVEIPKPTYDYMSSFLARSTQPLGLKDAPEVRRLLEQKACKWAIRSGKRHILN